MIEIKTFQCNPLQENCFIVSDEAKEAVAIDCGAFFPEERKAVARYIKDNGLNLCHVLCTHAHFDHIFGLDTLYEEFGISPKLHAADIFLYDKMSEQLQAFMGVPFDRQLPPLGDSMADGDTINFGSHLIKVIHTSGHSPGSVVLYMEEEKILFSGDTIFRLGVGRTDLEGGSWQQLLESLQRLATTLPDDVKVYAGHGPSTTMSLEKKLNPYFRY